MRISRLDAIAAEGGRIALWGWGREGRAAYRAIRARLPELPLTVLCAPGEAADVQAIGDAGLEVLTAVDAAQLSRYALVVKSPGISPYGADAAAAAEQGTVFVGGTALWFAEHADARGVVPGTICVTGTKGKSTTTSLLAHLLRAGGHVTALAGNIGLPLLELPDAPEGAPGAPKFRVIELSSYQTGDVADSGARPQVAIALNIFPEHLDWHGSHERYVQDKLRLLTEGRPQNALLNVANRPLCALSLPGSEIRWFGGEEGWHLRGDTLFRGEQQVMDTAGLPLPGRHNRGNLCAVLTAVEALGLDAVALAPHAATFRPLPHRLQTLGVRDGITYVNDSISTTPHASLAALDCFSGSRVAILVGGHDRGLDWSAFVDAMKVHAPAAVITMGQNGPRIRELLAPLAAQSSFVLDAAHDLADAMGKARRVLLDHPQPGRPPVMLLSPGAPSFGPYRDYVARGRHFAQLAGFDPEGISAIPGLGIA